MAVFAAAVAIHAAGGAHRRSAACPAGALPLGADAIAPASRAAFAREPAKTRPQVWQAILASADIRGRGRQAKGECGERIWRRTVVVYIDLRALHPSASLSERVDFVSRFRNGFRVWEVVH